MSPPKYGCGFAGGIGGGKSELALHFSHSSRVSSRSLASAEKSGSFCQKVGFEVTSLMTGGTKFATPRRLRSAPGNVSATNINPAKQMSMNTISALQPPESLLRISVLCLSQCLGDCFVSCQIIVLKRRIRNFFIPISLTSVRSPHGGQ